MEFPINIPTQIQGYTQTVLIYDGITTIVGPNGSGKTQLLRQLKHVLSQNRYKLGNLQYLSSGRLAPHESYRSDNDGSRGDKILYDAAEFGSSQNRQYRYRSESINGLIHTLSLRADLFIKVSVRLRKLFNREILLIWDAGHLKLKFINTNTKARREQYSSAREASGLLHLVALLTAFYDDEIGVLLIDEPELSLHPQLQAFLLSEMKKVAGNPESAKKLIIIATHSTSMIDIRNIEDLSHVVFCESIDIPFKQLDSTVDELKSTKLRELIVRLNEYHKQAFFCKKPLLVEGDSDAILCSGISSYLNLNLEASGVQIVPVIGKGQFPVVIKLMRLLGKNPIVLADADAFTDSPELINSFSLDERLNDEARNLGHKDIMEFRGKVFDPFCKLIDAHWSDIENKAQEHSYWQNIVTNNVDEVVKIKRRSAFATLMNLSSKDLEVMNNYVEWSNIKTRLMVFLDTLEKAGCFILRKGTIESYYKFTSYNGSSGKSLFAVNEIYSLDGKDLDYIQFHYDDLVRLLEYASDSDPINEIEAIVELVAGLAATIMINLKDRVPTPAELDAIMRRNLGDKADIFYVEILDNKLHIDLKSKILDARNFPIVLSEDDNLNSEIRKQLGLDSIK